MMQSTAGRRAIATLAAKLHPPTPLSQQESKQLLNLLTTSFRKHLDREHPVSVNKTKATANNSIQSQRSASSYSSTHDHIESILSNPLMSRQPVPKDSPNAAVRLLEDPVEWFLDQIAIGTADITKATLCLQIAKQNHIAPTSQRKPSKNLATSITDWLHSSGLENSSAFLDSLILGKKRGLLNTLVPMLMHDEKNQAPLWRWLTRSSEQRMKETGLSADRIMTFRSHLLKEMGICAYTSNPDEAFVIFLRALKMYKAGEYDIGLKMIHPLGSTLVGLIERESPRGSVDLYESFLNSTSTWLKTWRKAVDAMLWMHHPTRPTPYPGLEFITTSNWDNKLSNSRRRFVVRLSLGLGRQLLEQEKTAEARFVLDVTQKHFRDLVLPEKPHAERVTNKTTSQEEEIWSPEMLDRLLPT